MDALSRGRTVATMAPVWAAALVGGVLVVVFSGIHYLTWLPVVAAGCLLAAFGIQLLVGMRPGLVARLGGSVGGAVAVLLVFSVVLVLVHPVAIPLVH